MKSVFSKLGDHLLFSAQRKQQAQLAEQLEGAEGIQMTNSIIRGRKGEGGPALEELSYAESSRKQILMLIAGPTDRVTYMEQAMPTLYSLGAKEVGFERDERVLEELKAALESNRAGIAEAVFKEAVRNMESARAHPTKNLSFPDYIQRRAGEIREKVFDGQDSDLTVIRNANAQDLRSTSRLGGQNRALLFHGHGNRKVFLMTDQPIPNCWLDKPEEKLRALIFDACGGASKMAVGSEEIGEGFAETVYGFNQPVGFEEIFARPIQKRQTWTNWQKPPIQY